MMKKWLSSLGADISVLLLGIGLTFAFAPYEIFPLAVLCPAGLLACWLKATPKRAFWLGFLFGVGFFGAGVYWIFISIHEIGDVPTPLAFIITSGLIFLMSCYPALVGYLLNRYFPQPSPTKLLCAFPALWVFSEWFRSWLLTGFPWLLLGYSQTNSPLKGFAPIFGVYGLSLALVFTSGILVSIVIHYRQRAYAYLYIGLLGIAGLWTAGTLLNLIPWTQEKGSRVPVSLVQGNIPQTLKWSPEHLQLSLDRYASLTEPLWAKNKLIIWPEAAVPLPLPNAAGYIQKLDDKAKANNAHLILGIPIPAPTGGYFNSIVTLGEQQTVYNKRHLVPFGEYTPFSHFFANLFQFMNIPMADMVAGDPTRELLNVGELTILASICYEIAYPELINLYDKNISFILTLTNDAWFGKSNAEAQHLQMAQMRAIELRRPALFVSNDGITAIIDEEGRVQAALPQFETGILSGVVQPRYGLTPWMRNGMEPLFFILICLLGTAIYARRKITRAEKNTLQSQQF